jgi:hypothetical protein
VDDSRVARRGLTAKLFAGTLVAVAAACGGDDTESERTSDSVATDSTVAASVVDKSDTTTATSEPQDEPIATTTPASTTALTVPPTAVRPEAGEPIVTEAAPTTDRAQTSRVVAYRDGFVQLRLVDGVAVVSVSEDGSAWSDLESTPPLAGYPQAFSNGERIVALMYPLDGINPVPWISDDGGATWTELPLPALAGPAQEFVIAEFMIGGVALSADRVVLAGAIFRRVDWMAYSRSVLGEDHGHPGSEGGSPTGWTVTFEDGFEMTVDLVAEGLPEMLPPVNVTMLTHDGSDWLEPISIPLPGPASPPSPVFGPAGFAIVTGPVVYMSIDGVDWTTTPSPVSGSSSGFPQELTVVGGPLGYVLANSEALYHSRDGVEWAEVHRFATADASGFPSQRAMNPSAGGAGFVVPVMSHAAPPDRTVRYLWSSDGLTWTEGSLRSDVEFVDSAVSAVSLLVLPYVTPDMTASMPTLPANDADLAATIARAFYAEQITDPEGRVVWRPWVTESEATCIGAELVGALGADTLRELHFGVFPFTLLGYGLGLQIDMDSALVIADTIRGCSPNWELLIIMSATQGTQYISEDSARCTQSALDDDVAEQIFAIELARPYDEQPGAGGPDLSHLEPLVQAMEECLSDQELNAIDWD